MAMYDTSLMGVSDELNILVQFGLRGLSHVLVKAPLSKTGHKPYTEKGVGEVPRQTIELYYPNPKSSGGPERGA